MQRRLFLSAGLAIGVAAALALLDCVSERAKLYPFDVPSTFTIGPIFRQLVMTKSLVVLCGLALILSNPHRALAQVGGSSAGVRPVPASMGIDSIPAEPHLFGQVRFGSVTVAPTLRLSEIGFDTNVFNLDGTERLPPDFTATVLPGLETRLDTSRAGLRALANGGLVYYRKHQTERSINPNVALDGFFKMGPKVELFGQVSGGHGREMRGYEIDTRPRVSSRGYGLGVRFAGRRLGWDAVARHGYTRYDETAKYLGVQLNQTLDRQTQSTDIRMSYRLTPYTTFAIGASAIGERFPLLPARDTAANRVHVTAAFNPRALINGNLQVGYVHGNILSNHNPDFSGATANGGLAYTWRDSFSVSVGASRDFDFSYHPTHAHYRYDVYEGAIRQALFRRFDIGVGLSQATLSYPSVPDVPDLLVQVYRQLSASTGVRVKGQARVGVYVRRIEREPAPRGYREYRSGLEFTIGKVNLNERGVFLHGVSR